MTQKNKFLKNLFTTASVIAVTASAGSAMGAVLNNAGGGATVIGTANSANLYDANAVPVQFVDGDDFQYQSQENLSTSTDLTIGKIDLNDTDLNGKTLTLGHNVKITTGIVDASAAGNNRVVNTIITGNTIFDTIALGGINSLTLQDKATVRFDGAGKATIAGAITLGDSSSLIMKTGADLTAPSIDGSAADKGRLVLEGQSTIAGNIGANNALESITLNKGTGTFAGDVINAKTIHLDDDAAIATFKGANPTTIKANFTTKTDGKGKLSFNTGAGNDTTINGNIGEAAVAEIKDKDGKVTQVATSAKGFETVDVGAAGKTLRLVGDNGSLNAGRVTGAGELILKGADYAINSNIGVQEVVHVPANGAIKAVLGVPATPLQALTLDGDAAGKAAATFTLAAGRHIDAKNISLNTAGHQVDNTLKLQDGSKITGNIVTTKDLTGSLEVSGNVVINGDNIGDTAGNLALNDISLTEATLTTNGKDIAAKTITFTGDNTLHLHYEGANASTVTSNVVLSDTDTSTITTKVADGQTLTFNGGIGVVADDDTARSLKEFKVEGKGKIDFKQAVNIGTLTLNQEQGNEITISNKVRNEIGAIANKEGTGTLNLTADGTVLSLGGHEKLALVNFKHNGTIEGAVEATKVDVHAVAGVNNKATFTGLVTADTLNIQQHAGGAANHSTVVFEGKNSGLVGDVSFNDHKAVHGKIEFNGSSIVKGNIGAAAAGAAGAAAQHRAHTVTFRDTNTTTGETPTKVAATIYSDNINIEKTNLEFTKDSIFNGATAIAKDASLALGSNILTVNSESLTLNGDIKISATVEGDDIGHIVIDGDGALNAAGKAKHNLVSGDHNIVLTIDNSTTDIAKGTKNYQLIELENKAGITGDLGINVSSLNNSEFITWAQDPANRGSLIRTVDPVGGVNKIVTEDKTLTEDEKNAVRAFATATGDSHTVLNDYAHNMNSTQRSEFAKRVAQSTAIHNEEAFAGALNGVSLANDARLSTLGAAAGEGDASAYGAWMTPFYSTTTQKDWKNVAGYKSKATGATVGFDTMVNDDLTIGLAGSYIKTDMKHTGKKNGDKTKINSAVASLYAMQQLSNNWFLQAQTSFANNQVKNTQKRISSTGDLTATGKFDTTSYTAELVTGHNYKVSDITITPTAGASFTRISGYGYNETGAGLQNHKVSAGAANKFQAILGLKAQTTYDMNGVAVTPEVHVAAKRDLNAKNTKVLVSANGINELSNKAGNNQKTTANVGLGVNAVSDMYEFGAGYDLHLAKKSVGHQGTLKVRLNF